MNDLNECINSNCLVDLRYTRIYFTWSNRRYNRTDFRERKLDRALVNQKWLDIYPNSHAMFRPAGISDHSPCIVDMGMNIKRKGTPFKFYNYWTSLDNFHIVIQNAWHINVQGTFQFQLSQKLRHTKTELKKFAKKKFRKEKQNVDAAREALFECQALIDRNPNDWNNRAKENVLMTKLLEALRIEEDAVRQRSKTLWLELGDKNTNYFYNSIKGRWNRKRITNLVKPDGDLTQNEGEAKSEAIRHFMSMMGSPTLNPYHGIAAIQEIVDKRIPPHHIFMLEQVPEDSEIKNAMFSIHSNKAPGPDGYNYFFFKHCWDTMGELVTKAVKEFFTSKEVLKETNTTIISLIPKTPNPSSMGDFRPISCCNTIYKCISKILSKRLQAVLPEIIDTAQSAFVKGRKLSDNVLLAQDLMKDYHKSHGKPRAAAKVDIMKAYDTVTGIS